MTELKDSERTLCEIWTRVMGYFRPMDNYNKGKKSEFKERTYFNQNKAMAELNDDATNIHER